MLHTGAGGANMIYVVGAMTKNYSSSIIRHKINNSDHFKDISNQTLALNS